MGPKSVRFSDAVQPAEVTDIRGRWARAKAAKEQEKRDAAKKALQDGNTEPEFWTAGGAGAAPPGKKEREEEARLRMLRAKESNVRKSREFKREWGWSFGILSWIL